MARRPMPFIMENCYQWKTHERDKFHNFVVFVDDVVVVMDEVFVVAVVVVVIVIDGVTLHSGNSYCYSCW